MTNAMELVNMVPSRLASLSDLVAELLNHLVEEVDSAPDLRDDELPWQVAELLTPVWNDEVWQLFTDLALYDVDDTDVRWPTEMSPTEWARSMVHWAIRMTAENLQASRGDTKG